MLYICKSRAFHHLVHSLKTTCWLLFIMNSYLTNNADFMSYTLSKIGIMFLVAIFKPTTPDVLNYAEDE